MGFWSWFFNCKSNRTNKKPEVIKPISLDELTKHLNAEEWFIAKVTERIKAHAFNNEYMLFQITYETINRDLNYLNENQANLLKELGYKVDIPPGSCGYYYMVYGWVCPSLENN